MKLITLIIIAALTSCGTQYNVTYSDEASGVTAGYSSKSGLNIHYRQPLRDK